MKSSCAMSTRNSAAAVSTTSRTADSTSGSRRDRAWSDGADAPGATTRVSTSVDEVLQVARAERHAEVALDEPLEDRRDLLLRRAHLPRRAVRAPRSLATRSAAIAMCITTSEMPNSLTK